MERLSDVIVRTSIKRRYLVFLAVAHSQHQNPQAGQAVSYLTTCPDASNARHIDVQKDDIVFGCTNELQRCLAGGGLVHFEPHPMECAVQRTPNGTLIVNDQNLAVRLTHIVSSDHAEAPRRTWCPNPRC